MAQVFKLEGAAAAPLVITFPISGAVSIVTTVTGDARQNASVQIVNGAFSLWSTQLTQFTPTATLPYDVIAGEMTFKQGGSFTLTIPTVNQNGNVVTQCIIVTPTNPKGQPFAAMVASWTLSSAV